MKFPVLKDNDLPFYPLKKSGCPICGCQFTGGFVYLCGGAIPQEESDLNLLGFLHVGFHSATTECIGSTDLDIVENLRGGQFDFGFCSSPCLRQFFSSIVDQLEAQLS